MKKRNQPVCTMCLYKPDSDSDSEKFLPAIFKGKLHIRLQKTTHNLYVCPKCGTMTAVKGFKKPEPFWITQKRLRSESAARIEELRRLYH